MPRRLIRQEMNAEPARGSDIDLGIGEIEQRRLIRTIRRYVRQHEACEASERSEGPVPHLFEVVFGLEASEAESYSSLELGTGTDRVRLQGKIDRIDLMTGSQGTSFRVIDYKTGSCPSKNDVKEAIYLQLPLCTGGGTTGVATRRSSIARRRLLGAGNPWF